MPGRRMSPPDIASPSATEMPSPSIATIPNARLANQKSWLVGSTISAHESPLMSGAGDRRRDTG